jgi:hypothetical protein
MVATMVGVAPDSASGPRGSANDEGPLQERAPSRYCTSSCTSSTDFDLDTPIMHDARHSEGPSMD